MSDLYDDWRSPEDGVINHVLFAGDYKLHNYVTLGSEPFTFVPDVVPRQHKPATKGVWIGSRVEIFDHANVDRGTERDTFIGDNTVIDRHVHVAHDTFVGQNCIIVAGTVIGGFVTLEDDVYLGINVSVKPRVRIGRGCKVGMGAVVIRDLPPGCVVVGSPARILKLRYDPSWYREYVGDLDPGAYVPQLKWNGEKWVLPETKR